MVSKPVVRVEEHQDGTRIRVACGSAEVWIRATPAGRRLEIAIEEGEGEVDVQWSIRRARTAEPIVQTGPFVQSPYPIRGEPRPSKPIAVIDFDLNNWPIPEDPR